MLVFADKKGRDVLAPQFSYPIADTHTHLSMLPEEIGAARGIARAAFAGVGLICEVADITENAKDPDAFLAALKEDQNQAQAIINQKIAEGYDLPECIQNLPEKERLPSNIKVVAGAHPHYASEYNDEVEAKLKYLLEQEEVVAIGEIGLDYHYDKSPHDIQREVFRKQLKLAHDLNMPVDLHVRDAHDDAYQILQELGLPKAGCVLHCFTLGPDDFNRFAELGCIFSIGGAVTFNKSDDIREAVRLADQNLIMSETDAPFMAPVPLRGVPCEPAMTTLTMECMKNERDKSSFKDGELFVEQAYKLASAVFNK